MTLRRQHRNCSKHTLRCVGRRIVIMTPPLGLVLVVFALQIVTLFLERVAFNLDLVNLRLLGSKSLFQLFNGALEFLNALPNDTQLVSRVISLAACSVSLVSEGRLCFQRSVALDVGLVPLEDRILLSRLGVLLATQSLFECNRI